MDLVNEGNSWPDCEAAEGVILTRAICPVAATTKRREERDMNILPSGTCSGLVGPFSGTQSRRAIRNADSVRDVFSESVEGSEVRSRVYRRDSQSFAAIEASCCSERLGVFGTNLSLEVLYFCIHRHSSMYRLRRWHLSFVR